MRPYCEARFGDLVNMGGKYHGHPVHCCGHRHRTLGAARKCKRKYHGPQGEYPFHLGVYINAQHLVVPEPMIEGEYMADSTTAAEAGDRLSE